MTATNLPDAQAFLAFLDPDADIWTFQTFDDTKSKRPQMVRVIHGTLEQHLPELERLNGLGAGVFVTINETDGQGRRAENITRVRAVFADFDTPDTEAPSRLLADLLPPSIIVESSPGKYHAYWLLDDELPLEQFEPLQKAIIAAWGSDPNVCDLPRVMRLPGFQHRKGESQPVRLIECDVQRYPCAAMLARYPEAEKVPQKRPPVGSGLRGLVPCVDPTPYGQRAIDCACEAIAGTLEGGRNAALNREAFGIAQLVAGGEIPENLARERLTAAAEQAGLETGEIAPTLDSAWRKGLTQPRTAPGSAAMVRAAFRDTTEGAPLPLVPDIEAAAPYPLEALPPLMRAAAQAIAEYVQAPLALAGQCVIGAAVYLAQTRVNAPHLHRESGMPCSLFLLTLADSGDRKSECRRLAFKTVDEAEERARTVHRQTCDGITSEAAGLRGKELEQFNAEHPLPTDPRTQYSDATFERIAGDMIRGTSAASWDTDEGGQVLGGASLKADTRAATLGGLVKAFDTGAFERTRSHSNLEGSGFAYNRRLSVHLLAQAVTVAAALDDPLLRGQGFLPRFLFSSPASIAGTRLLTAEQLGRSAYADPRLQRYWERCRAIGATAQAIDPATGEVRPPAMELTAEAEAKWLEFYNGVEGEQSALGQFAGLRPFAGRAGEIARRLAAVFACFEGQQQIDGECMRRASALVLHSLSEWLRYTDGVTVNLDLQRAAALLEWLQSNHWAEFDARALQREGPRFVRKSAQQRDALLAVLVKHHLLLTSDGKHFTINPLATTATTATSHGR